MNNSDFSDLQKRICKLPRHLRKLWIANSEFEPCGKLTSKNLTTEFEKLITSAKSQSSNSPEFISTLQKFHEMIYKIIVSKILCRTFLVFFCLHFFKIISLWRTMSRKVKLWKFKISWNIYFLKVSAHYYEDFIFTNKLEEFFVPICFSRAWSFFHEYKTTNLGWIFCTKN